MRSPRAAVSGCRRSAGCAAYVEGADGSHLVDRKLAQPRKRARYTISASPWSADGTQIAFTRRPYLQAAGGTVYVAALRNGTIRQIAGFAGGPATWSSDGTRLVFDVQRGCKIRVVSVDASSPFETLPLDGCDPAWRPAS